MSVLLRPIREDELAAWYPLTRDGYAADMVHAGGLSPERAAAKAAADMERLIPGGRPGEGQLVYVVEADGEPVGNLWVAVRDETFQAGLFIYNVYVDEAYRGRGYGKAAMLLAEEEARRLGVDRISLNVFGGNEVARGLYRSLGYSEDAVSMSKAL